MRKIVVVAALVAAVVAAPARALDGPGVTLGLRLGVGVPIGSYAQGATISDTIAASVPFMVDVDYRFTRNLWAGIYGQYAAGIANNCPAGESCSGTSWRLGLQGSWHFAPGERFDPYLGLGTGYEWMSIKEEAGGLSAEVKFEGFEFASLQAGFDYTTDPKYAFGPFVGLTFSQFSSGSVSGSAGSGIPAASGDIQNKTVHSWLQFGIRGRFDL